MKSLEDVNDAEGVILNLFDFITWDALVKQHGIKEDTEIVDNYNPFEKYTTEYYEAIEDYIATLTSIEIYLFADQRDMRFQLYEKQFRPDRNHILSIHKQYCPTLHEQVFFICYIYVSRVWQYFISLFFELKNENVFQSSDKPRTSNISIRAKQNLTLRQKLLIILYLQDQDLFPKRSASQDAKPFNELLGGLFNTDHKSIEKMMREANFYKSGKTLSTQQKKECRNQMDIVKKYFDNMDRFDIVGQINSRIKSL